MIDAGLCQHGCWAMERYEEQSQPRQGKCCYFQFTAKGRAGEGEGSDTGHVRERKSVSMVILMC